MRSIVVAAIRGDRLTCIFPASIPQPAPRSGAPQVSWIPTYAEIRAAAPRETAFCRSEVAFCEAEQDHRDTPFTVWRVPSVGAPCRAGGGLTRMVLFVALMTPKGGAERDGSGDSVGSDPEKQYSRIRLLITSAAPLAEERSRYVVPSRLPVLRRGATGS